MSCFLVEAIEYNELMGAITMSCSSYTLPTPKASKTCACVYVHVCISLQLGYFTITENRKKE